MQARGSNGPGDHGFSECFRGAVSLLAKARWARTPTYGDASVRSVERPETTARALSHKPWRGGWDGFAPKRGQEQLGSFPMTVSEKHLVRAAEALMT